MKKKPYAEFSTIAYDDELPAANQLAPIMASITCSTFPTKVLARQVRLLTPSERNRCDKLWKEICNKMYIIDNVIEKRAEIECDIW